MGLRREYEGLSWNISMQKPSVTYTYVHSYGDTRTMYALLHVRALYAGAVCSLKGSRTGTLSFWQTGECYFARIL